MRLEAALRFKLDPNRRLYRFDRANFGEAWDPRKSPDRQYVDFGLGVEIELGRESVLNFFRTRSQRAGTHQQRLQIGGAECRERDAQFLLEQGAGRAQCRPTGKQYSGEHHAAYPRHPVHLAKDGGLVSAVRNGISMPCEPAAHDV
jgi:hypothetical protein